MPKRFETMQPSAAKVKESRPLFRSALISQKPRTIRKRIAGNKNKIESTSTSTSIRDDTMELLPMPPRKRLRRAEKIYPKNNSVSDGPWWNQIQIGDELPGSFNSWLGMNSGSDELDCENKAFAMRSTSISSISSDSSDIAF